MPRLDLPLWRSWQEQEVQGSQPSGGYALVEWEQCTKVLQDSMTMWHNSQIKLWSSQQNTEPGNQHHHRGHETNVDKVDGNNYRASVMIRIQGLQIAKPGCNIHKAARQPYKAVTVPANREEDEERESNKKNLPELNTWKTTLKVRQPWSWPQRDPLVFGHSCLNEENSPPEPS